MRRDHLLIFCLFLIACCLPVGCGSGTANRPVSPVPEACSQDSLRPNYCGDVNLFRFSGTIITYRIILPDQTTPTDIYTHPITATFPTAGQADSIRGGFAKWQVAIGQSRQIVEVPAADSTAMIDVLVQPPAAFTASGITEQLGRTDTWTRDVEKREYGRCVIRLRVDLDQRAFRYVALHEIGHSLGIAGHSRHLGDVLYPIALPVTPLVELTDYDINTIRANYQQ